MKTNIKTSLIIVLPFLVSSLAILVVANHFFLFNYYTGAEFVVICIAGFLAYNNKRAGWYLGATYYAYKFVLDVIRTISFITSLSNAGNSNWGGSLSYVFGAIPLIWYGTMLYLLLKQEIRNHYKINLPFFAKSDNN